ncbi:EpsG family protein [Ferrimonas sp. YFM]|uniref:EpsG family protein n=1 Tax=Ferrimonas sp. YFM TaxID=3028878 RepID=UPI00257303BA|nr:EpsG family protein [Ferrimonas sp. YFM]BDY04077.1 polymerase [Ferrimonas sp. YFM]
MYKVKSFSVFIFLSMLISIFTGIRLPDVGRDTEAYIEYFHDSSIDDGFYDRFEPGFSLLMQLLSKAGLSVEVFFTCVAFIITVTYLYIFKRTYKHCFLDKNPSTSIITIFFSLLLFSSWYIASTTNGLRQGLALVFLYLSLLEFFYNSHKLKFVFLFVIATLFHYSSILILPFLALHYLRFRFVFIIWVLVGLGFALGVNELGVKLISETFGLPIYEYVKYYSLEKGSEELGGGMYEGFITSFFIYTILWPLILLFVLKVKTPIKEKMINTENVYILLKIYFSLSLVYFVMGFGPFSNRYALFSWMLVPIMQIVIFRLSIRLQTEKIIPLFFLFSSLVFFLYLRLDWIRFIK